MKTVNTVATTFSSSVVSMGSVQKPATTRPPARPATDGISVEEQFLADAWSQVAAAITACNVGLTEDGDTCILLTTRPNVAAVASDSRWLMWRSHRKILLRRVGFAIAPVAYDSMHHALQSVAPLSETERRSVALIAEAMLLSVTAGDDVVDLRIAA